MSDHELPPPEAETAPDHATNAPLSGATVDESLPPPSAVGQPGVPPHSASAWRPIHFILLAATCVSTFVMGTATVDVPPPQDGQSAGPDAGRITWDDQVRGGLTYSIALMSILFAHEMGHYLQARRYRVAASPPYFIPMPAPPFGTMGAVIVQRSGFADRKRLFDIAISGPLAGLVIALPVAWYGIAESRIEQIPPSFQGNAFGEPLVFQWISNAIHGPRGAGEDLILNPLLFAGWVGIFITALNLIPIGQLDGGHILYALIGRKAHTAAVSLTLLAIVYMVMARNHWYALIMLLLILTGIRHPPTGNDRIPLGRGRIVLGWLTLAFIVIGFTPVPIHLPEEEKPKPEKTPAAVAAGLEPGAL